jgi:hypothetical protein
MLASPDRVIAPTRTVPADLDTALRLPDWRERVWWPVGTAEANRIGTAQVRAALAWAASHDGLLRDAALLALPNIVAYARAIVFLAVATSRAGRAGAQLLSNEPELAYLLSGEGPLPDRSAPIMVDHPMRFELARRVLRVHSWSSPLRTLAAFVDPAAVAVSHNPLLRKAAAKAGQPIGFRHSDALLDEARRRTPSEPTPAHDAESLALAVLCNVVLEEPYRTRTLVLLQSMAQPHLALAVRDVQALRYAQLPKTLWSGTGGLYAQRAIGIEVLRRGGDVVRFDHGKPKGFVEACEIDALVEFAVSSEFVVPTEDAAAMTRRYSDEGLLPWMRHPRIRGIGGDPTFARLPAKPVSHNSSRRLRVVYAPTQLLGFRQLLPVQTADVVYLDWQIKVGQALSALPIEFTCQPHPEGLFRGRPHPLEKIAPSISGNFDAQFERADVFVFDYPSTTALWQVACTGARIVFLDIGSGHMTPHIAALFAERARTIEVACDADNRPVLDTKALADAVLSAGTEVDPTPFRRLLAGAE